MLSRVALGSLLASGVAIASVAGMGLLTGEAGISASADAAPQLQLPASGQGLQTGENELSGETATGEIELEFLRFRSEKLDSVTQTQLRTSVEASNLNGLILDPDAGGSDEVVYPDPSEPEQEVPGSPAAPTNLQIAALGEDFVTLTFTSSAGITSYQAYIRHGDSYTLTGLGSASSVTFSDLTPDFDYVACVFYRLGEVESNRACVDVHTDGQRDPEPDVIAAPTGIELSATQTTLAASWTAVAGAASYRVCHVSGDSSWQCGGYVQLAPTHIEFRDGSIRPATRYGVTVVAVMPGGATSEQAIAYITTPGTPPPPPEKYPAATNLRIVSASPTSIEATWDYPNDATVTVWSFTVRRLTSYASYGVAGDARSFEVTNLQPGTGYEIILIGRDSSGKTTEEVRLGFITPAS